MPAYPVPQRELRGHKPARPSDRAALSPQHQAYLAAHLTARDRWIVRLLAEHRVLTAIQIAQLGFPSIRTANRRLLWLYRSRVLDRFQPYLTVGSAPMHYVLDTAGAATLTAEHNDSDSGVDAGANGMARRSRYRHDRAMQIAHSLRLAHTVGVNGFFADLVAVARHSNSNNATRPNTSGRAVTAWWSETRCTHYFGEYVRPDAYGRWREDPNGHDTPLGNPDAEPPFEPRGRSSTDADEVEFFLEYDTGTEPLTRVADKLTGYEALATATGIVTPVLFWFHRPTREANARHALAAALAALNRPALVPIATTAAMSHHAGVDAAHAAERDDPSHHAPDSPAAARWLPLDLTTTNPASAAPAPGAARRVRLVQLASLWPNVVPSTSSSESPDVAGDPARLTVPPPAMPPTTPLFSVLPETASRGDKWR